METTHTTSDTHQAWIGSKTTAATATEWSTPHPVAYLFRVSRGTEALKPFLKDYCSKIQLVRKTRNAVQQQWLEDQQSQPPRKPSRKRSRNKQRKGNKRSSPSKTAFWIREMEALDDDEQMYRANFQLARCLWQLEGTLAKTYLALTRWRRSVEESDRLERRVKNGSNSDNGNDNGNDNDLLLKQQDAETEQSAIEYEDCGYEQASVSKDIGDLLPCCDDTMVDYLDANYCHCTVCNYYFSKKDLGILGLIRRRPKNPDYEKNLRNGTWWKSFFSEESEEEHENGKRDGDDKDENDDRFDCFYCLECYKKIMDHEVTFKESEQEQEQDELDAAAEKSVANALTDSSTGNSSSEASDPDLDPTEPTTPRHGESNSSSSSPKKRRKRKKKKKASTTVAAAAVAPAPAEVVEPAAEVVEPGGVAADESSSSSSPSKTKHQAASSLSCPSPTSVILEYTTMTKAAATSKMETETETEIEYQSQREEESDCCREEPNAFLEAMDRASASASASDERSTSHNHAAYHDPNELWVDYLCKTRSIIALDRYMDEMDPFLRDGDGDGNYSTACATVATTEANACAAV
mmetsp:Transcript_2902/g.7906  ORF Transcript_2902/g.7906 Transcript_2902/m.7906 type:complete len:578 (-) Transcript_2902:256-1989(-)